MTPGGLYASTVAIVGATTLVGCSSRDPYGRNILVPEGSIYVEPTQEVGKLGYTIAHVDTIIGYIEAYRFHGGLDSEADRLLVDVFTTAATGRRIVSVAPHRECRCPDPTTSQDHGIPPRHRTTHDALAPGAGGPRHTADGFGM
jgi:hypothetical protein